MYKSNNSSRQTHLDQPNHLSHDYSSLTLLQENKENEAMQPKPRISQSPSLLSLRGFTRMRKSPTLNQIPIISQPTLDESSREKVHNKIKQSPSILSINQRNGHSELLVTQRKRMVEQILRYTDSGRLEKATIDDKKTRHSVREINLSHLSDFSLLQTLKINRLLASNAGFALLKVRVVSNDSDVIALLETDDLGTSLDRFQFNNCNETLVVLLKVAQILANAESQLQFEHRNLHAGNIMINREPRNGTISQVTILNCELSRLEEPRTHEVLYTPLDHPEFYRSRLPVLSHMRSVISDPKVFAPVTNVFWLVYLARYLYNNIPSAQMKRCEEVLRPKWGGLRKAPQSAQEALPRLLRKM